MKNNMLPIILVALIVIGGVVYYQQQHTHTASIDLPGKNDIKITTHD